MSERKVIGKVIALERQPATVDEFYFWTDPDTILAPFDVVVVEHLDDSLTFGQIEEISHISDSGGFLADYISYDFGNLNVRDNTDRVGMNYVKARVLLNNRNVYAPVHNGAPVCLGTDDDVKKALGLEEKSTSVVCGYLSMYENIVGAKVEMPAYVDVNFLLGPEGAHLNISGISGLASKTSYAMFLLNALQQRSMARKSQKEKTTAYVILNVKGRDLLRIDEPSKELSKEDRALYKKMNLDVRPFKNVKYFYPCAGGNKAYSYVLSETLNRQREKKIAFVYKYLFEDDKESLDLLLSNIDDPNQTMESIVNSILNGDGIFAESDNWTWSTLIEKVGEKASPKQEKQSDKTISVMSWRKFNRVLKKTVESYPLFSESINDNPDEVRLEDEIKKIQPNDVYVIDVAKHDENMQAFIFGTVMRAATRLKLGEFEDESEVAPPDRIVIFVDELNKYASNDTAKSSPVLQLLLDIAERGRSLGVVLISAEQFKSAVHKRITGNCAVHAYGRTNSIEVSEKAYSFVPSSFKRMMTRLKQGDYILQCPTFNSLLSVRFPQPLYFQDKGDSQQ